MIVKLEGRRTVGRTGSGERLGIFFLLIVGLDLDYEDNYGQFRLAGIIMGVHDERGVREQTRK